MNDSVLNNVNFLDICKARESVRGYKPVPIEKEKLDYVLEAARLAPSACNRQPWKFLVLESADALSKAALCYDRDWFRSAPLAILCCIDHSQEWVRPADGKQHGTIDIAIAAEHICMAAAEQGLGSCWICNFDVDKASGLFDLQDNLEPAVLIPIGYSASVGVREKSRKNLSEIVETR